MHVTAQLVFCVCGFGPQPVPPTEPQGLPGAEAKKVPPKLTPASPGMAQCPRIQFEVLLVMTRKPGSGFTTWYTVAQAVLSSATRELHCPAAMS